MLFIRLLGFPGLLGLLCLWTSWDERGLSSIEDLMGIEPLENMLINVVKILIPQNHHR